MITEERVARIERIIAALVRLEEATNPLMQGLSRAQVEQLRDDIHNVREDRKRAAPWLQP